MTSENESPGADGTAHGVNTSRNARTSNSINENSRGCESKQPAIFEELLSAQADPSTDEILVRCEVLPEISPICGRAHIRGHGRFFEFDDNADPAIVGPIFEGGELVDLFAFRVETPANFRVRLGTCPLLGIDTMGVWSEPLHVWRTPLDYLRAGLVGVVVLDWPGAAPLLRPCKTIKTEDEAHAREIRQRLRESVELPEILYPDRRAAE